MGVRGRGVFVQVVKVQRSGKKNERKVKAMPLFSVETSQLGKRERVDIYQSGGMGGGYEIDITASLVYAIN